MLSVAKFSIPGSYIFNTEAHPIDTAALYCCSAEKKEHDLDLQNFYDNLDLLTLFNLYEDTDKVEGVRWSTYKKRNIGDSDIPNFGALEDLEETVKRYQTGITGDHQRVMSTKGQKFTLNAKESSATKVVTIDSKNINRLSQQAQQNVPVQELQASQSETQPEQDLKIAQGKGQQNTEAANSLDTSEKYAMEGSNKDLNVEENKEIIDHENTDADETDSVRRESVPRVTIRVNTKEAVHKSVDAEKTTTSESFVYEPLKPEYATSSVSGKETMTDVLNLIKSFTEEYLENHGVKSVKTLHEKLKYYSLFHQEKTDMLTCEAQPFYMRFSLMGEMFLNDFL